MSTDANKAIIRRYVDELNRRNFDILDELVADQVRLGSLNRGETTDNKLLTRDAYREAIQSRIRVFPDYHVTINEMIAEDDQVVLYWEHQGRQEGEFLGVPATGDLIAGAAISIYRIAGERIVEVRGLWDRADTWQQLGLIVLTLLTDEGQAWTYDLETQEFKPAAP